MPLSALSAPATCPACTCKKARVPLVASPLLPLYRLLLDHDTRPVFFCCCRSWLVFEVEAKTKPGNHVYFNITASPAVAARSPHSHRIRGRGLVPRPGNAVPIRGSGLKRVSVPFKVGSRPNLRGVAAPLLADLIEIRRLLIAD